jgi:hypothetical protein
MRYLLGFTVGVSIGLAPFLGLANVPLFRPLLDLYPQTLQASLIPLSAFVMGLTAVWVQWYGTVRLAGRSLTRWFNVAGVAMIGSFILVIGLRTLFVTDIPIQGGQSTVAFVVGSTRLPTCKCGPEVDALCITDTLTFNPLRIEECWGSGVIRLRELLLVVTYLVLVASFGLLVGAVLLRGRTDRERRATGGRPRTKATPSSN